MGVNRKWQWKSYEMESTGELTMGIGRSMISEDVFTCVHWLALSITRSEFWVAKCFIRLIV